MLEEIFILLIIYQFKHFFADFPLQGKYMLKKFEDGWSFVLPLAVHAGVHAGFTFVIVFVFTRSIAFALMLSLFDFSIHFTMNRIKAGKKYLGRWKALTGKEFPTASDEAKRGNTYFWWSLGFDQMVHHLTHYTIIFCIVTYNAAMAYLVVS